jgi:spore coat protein U-like protein
VSGTVKLTNARPQATNNHAAYGRAPAAQDVGAGAYADTLILTMTF